MPFDASQLVEVTIEVSELGKMVLRRLGSLSSEETKWLHTAETHALPARTFVVLLIQKLLKSPASELNSIIAWSDDRLVEVGAKWLDKQRKKSQKQTEIHTLEEVKEAVYAYQEELKKELRESIDNLLKQAVVPPIQGAMAPVLESLAASWQEAIFPSLIPESEPMWQAELMRLPPSPTAATEAKLQELITEVRHWRQHYDALHAPMSTQTRLFISDIDSFSKVRDIPLSQVTPLLENGRLQGFSEDDIKRAFEEILQVANHTGDWGGERNDLYTANVLYNGANMATAFLLKGPSIKAPKNAVRELQIKDCGHNGDQLLRLRHSPATLLIVQFIGPISQAVIDDIEGKVREMRAERKEAYYCIIDGQATAHILAAYGKLKPETGRV